LGVAATMGAAAADSWHARPMVPVRRRAARRQGSNAAGGSFLDYPVADDDSDEDSADEEDSSDEAAIAQAGHLGAALGGALSLHDAANLETNQISADEADRAGLVDALDELDRAGLVDEPEPWAKISLSYVTSAAPSDRGKCKTCGQAIAQGSLVVAERQGGGHCHFGCKDFEKEVTEACLEARAGPCQERFVARPVGADEDVGSSEAERQVALTLAVDIESRSDRLTVRVPSEPTRLAFSKAWIVSDLTCVYFDLLCCSVICFYYQLVHDQIEVARRSVEEAADRQPWWVRTAFLRGSLWEGATPGLDNLDLNYPYSDDDLDEDSDTSSDEEEGGGNCDCEFCVATRMSRMNS
jgi:hypothetical protein